MRKNKWLMLAITLFVCSILLLTVYPAIANPVNNEIHFSAQTSTISLPPPSSIRVPLMNIGVSLTELSEDEIDQKQIDVTHVAPIHPTYHMFLAQYFKNDRDPLIGVSFIGARKGTPSYPLSVNLIVGSKWVGIVEIPAKYFSKEGQLYAFNIELSQSISLPNKEGYLVLGVFGQTDDNNYYLIGGKTGNPYSRGSCYYYKNKEWHEYSDGFDLAFITFTTKGGGGGGGGGDKPPVVSIGFETWVTDIAGWLSLLGSLIAIVKHGMVVGWL